MKVDVKFAVVDRVQPKQVPSNVPAKRVRVGNTSINNILRRLPSDFDIGETSRLMNETIVGNDRAKYILLGELVDLNNIHMSTVTFSGPVKTGKVILLRVWPPLQIEHTLRLIVVHLTRMKI